MKTSLQTHRRKAISTIIATILVVAMTIVAAGVLYTYFTTTASRAQNTAQVQIQASLAVPNGKGLGQGAITVTNSGSIAVTSLTATDPDATNCGTFALTAFPAGTIAPGGGTSTTFTCSAATSGTSTPITVTAIFANGATQAQVVTVTAE